MKMDCKLVNSEKLKVEKQKKRNKQRIETETKNSRIMYSRDES